MVGLAWAGGDWTGTPAVWLGRRLGSPCWPLTHPCPLLIQAGGGLETRPLGEAGEGQAMSDPLEGPSRMAP